MIWHPQFPPWWEWVHIHPYSLSPATSPPSHTQKGQLPKVTPLAGVRAGIIIRGLLTQGHVPGVPLPRHFSPCKKPGSCLLFLPLPTDSHFSSLPGNTAPGPGCAWYIAAPGPAWVWGEAPASTIGNAPAEPPSFLLESALEFLCSQCISLEVCPPSVAMVTILILHARKSRGTCWSHHQNLSLWKISRWHLSEIPTSWLIWEQEECAAVLISFNLAVVVFWGRCEIAVPQPLELPLKWWVIQFSQRSYRVGWFAF